MASMQDMRKLFSAFREDTSFGAQLCFRCLESRNHTETRSDSHTRGLVHLLLCVFESWSDFTPRGRLEGGKYKFQVVGDPAQ
ncbi:unnamed protein product [Clavelina lepadiformis]|uniref:Uncharacterized protein n=1 Tax=Clavelina lepadiformis TaxID=159417 RepID=A0ABP0F853_CLALP